MSLADAFIPVVRAQRELVMHQTWGHLKVDRRKRHPGYILFTAGEFRDVVVINSEFDDVPDSPWFYTHIHDFIMKKAGRREQCGKVFRFDGYYRVCLNGVGQFIGKVRVVRMPGRRSRGAR
ncbi:hypothetical protein D9M72_92440 [compost metagenome]